MMGNVRRFMRPPAGLNFDFSRPEGERALAPADGVSWRIFANPISLYIGGVAAVILELAEPSVRSGVWDHSGFRRDPALRLHRTGFAAMVTVYGPRTVAKEMIAHVVRVHGRVRGTTPGGVSYRANDPRLLDWVQATATFGFTEAYHLYVRALSPTEKAAAFVEAEPAAKLYGATGAPRSWVEWEALYTRTVPGLEGSDILAEFISIMSTAPILPAPLRWIQRLLVCAAVDMTPEPIRSLPQLRGFRLRSGGALLVRMLARGAALVPYRDMPPAQAARRLKSSRSAPPGR
ncbi:DUF2236 domain-containing protein [Stenotrophomonas sp. 364]|nr:DUF2236 domain-containing protein [Stenotrophomonas sp. 364]